MTQEELPAAPGRPFCIPAPLRPHSAAAAESQFLTTPKSFRANAWLYDNNLVEGARIWQESVLLPHYDSVLSLIYIREPIEHTEDVEEEADLDPGEFTLSGKHWPRK